MLGTTAQSAAVRGAPVAPRERIPALDVTRGAAVLGILLMNIWSFAGPQEIYDYPPGAADMGGAPLATWAVIHTLFEGSQRGLFSLLFGAGMLLMVTRLETRDPQVSSARIYYRRLGFLMLLGLFDLFLLLWPADILFIYALCGLALYPLRKLSARTLVALALVVFAAQGTLRYFDWQNTITLQQEFGTALRVQPPDAESPGGALPPPEDMPPATAERYAEWQRIEDRAHPDLDDPEVRESVRIVGQGDFGEFFVQRAQSSLVLLIVLGLKNMVLDSLGAMLLGMALLRAGVLTFEAGPRVYAWLAGVGYAVGLPLSAWETTTLIASDFDAVVRAQLMLHYDLRRMAVALGHLGTILLVCHAFPTSAVVTRLAPVGRMALTNYLGQSILCGLIFYTVGLGLYGQFTGYYLYLVVAAVWAVQIAFSNAWLARYRFGPFEWFWKSLTYRRRQPLRSLPLGRGGISRDR